MRRAAQVLLLAAAGALVAPAVAEACWSGYYCESYVYDAGGSVYGYSRTYGYYGTYFLVETSLTDSQWSTVSNWAQGMFNVTAEVWMDASSGGYYYIEGNHYSSYEWEGWYYDGTSYASVYVEPPPPPTANYQTPWLSGRSYSITITGAGFSEAPSTYGCNGGDYNINWDVTPTQISGDAWLSSILTPCQLEISVQGYTVATIQLGLSLPSGEESYGLWQFEMAGDFGTRVTPDQTVVRFLGRRVQEAITMHDSCYFQGSDMPQLPDIFKNSAWSVDSFNYYTGFYNGSGYIVDRIGLTGSGAQPWVQYYEDYIINHAPGSSCRVGGSQAMSIDGVGQYEAHDAGLYLYHGVVLSRRGNATVNIYW